MFGCFAVYVDKRIVFILRKRNNHTDDNGVWFATSKEYHRDLQKILPSMRSVRVLGKGTTNWQLIPEATDDFESEVLLLCEMVRKGDRRIGHVPKQRKSKN
jgi:hypothetical protein